MAGLKLKGIKKVYDNGFQAVKDFNLDIEDREFIVFVGPSGCGKSTTLRMIAGLEEISSGELYIDDKLVNDIPPKDRDIAMVFQNYALYPHMTVYENMAFALKLRKVSKAEIDKKVREAAKILDIEHLLDRKPKALSGGQRQRVAMGRAIVRSPKVFLMDEPLSNLDAKLRVQMRIEISKLYNELNTTFIYVTHDQTEAMTLGTRIVVMQDGVVQQVASPTEIYNHPANLFVAGFIGSPQMNMTYGQTSVENGKQYVKVFDKLMEIPEDKAKVIKEKNAENIDVIVGIRPENIYHTKEELAKPGVVSFSGVVDLMENLGAEIYIHIKKDGANFIIKSRTVANYKIGDPIEFGFDANKIHIFDKEEQNTIF
ncbi:MULTISPECIES: ABC transporter ATP-binding protein [unclassified Clostridium]|uniref:ABC transporter ATP-binding protein n=2 Tax=Clostridium TaxID=1485 RepID=UPI0025C0B2BE|nr:sn-glycerol-3-phosphate ABC transporter ATP-binding protein UgpC [Clostridium sp.]MCI6693210.1 sn-glycerol-3-phosphate ABC transporter ATP-binding protein UgpC [Clostridium sp.]MDY2630503.1 sn-glycerol-3-phosphate ABC transporter ATP-binding protein UgpC [Clostridium sp.]MDY4252202.1 sn-glycerol-3-phosphate ABC transporter ATP-binding protein UgpC [Clostridium sp.]MDY6227943.1 sn-glycerol-3-phosphate ABC transporter ATP-binding protein UgpC [Clostridium sp.]